MLANHVALKVLGYINECMAYGKAIGVLKELYVKPSNEVFARYTLATLNQQKGESLDEYL